MAGRAAQRVKQLLAKAVGMAPISLLRDPKRNHILLESLEQRTLLSAAVGGDQLTLQPSPITIAHLPVQSLTNIAVPAGVSSSLWSALGVANQPAQVAALGARSDAAGDVQVYIHVGANADVGAIAGNISKMGIKVDGFNADMHVVQAWIAPGIAQSLLALQGVSSLSLPDYATTNTGSVDSAGDSVLRADLERSGFGFTGAGIKVGVISDGVNHRTAVGSDLPTVTVNPSLPGNGDEGTAMLEIIHDLAPDASLYFSDGLTNLDYINSLAYMITQGCNVIVDDLTFFTEPYFSDGTLANDVQAVVNDGITYITSAGNASTPAGFFGTSHYQSMFTDDGQGSHFNNFNPGGTFNDFQQFEVLPGSTLNLSMQWSENFTGATSNYGLYLEQLSGTPALLAFANGTTTTPLRLINWTNTTASPVVVGAAIQLISGSSNRELEMFGFSSNGGTGAINVSTPTDALIGQEALTGVITVAASDSADPTHAIESFSSQGPSTIYTNFTTQTKTIRQTLDVTGVDDVETKVGQLGDFEDPFFGTSAAAPHVAAIAALMLQASPSLTPAQVEADLRSSALDLGTTGYDNSSGAGLVRADFAVATVLTTLSSGVLTITGTSLGDNISLTSSGGVLSIGFNGTTLTPSGTITSIVVNADGGNDTLTINSLPAGISSVTFNGGGNAPTDSLVVNSGTYTFDLGTPVPGTTNLVFNDSGFSQSLTIGAATVTFSTDVVSSTSNLSIVGNSASSSLTFTGSQHVASLSETGGAGIVLTATTGSLTFAGPISGNGNVTKNGAGTWILSGTNTYTGNTTINAGTLMITGSNPGTATIIASGATLQIGNGGTNGSIGSGAITDNGTLIFAHSNTLSLGNAISGSGALIQQGSGTTTLTGTSTYAGNTVVSSGTLQFTGSGNTLHGISGAGNLLVASGTKASPGVVSDGITGGISLTVNGGLQIRTNGTSSGTSVLNNLTLGPSGSLDLTNNKLILQSTAGSKAAAIATIQSEIAATQISATGMPPTEGIAVADNSITLLGSFGGQTVGSNSVLLSEELLGDTNLDGSDNLTDLSVVLNNFGSSTSNWTSGNFDGAPTIDLTDLSDVLNNFGTTNPLASAIGVVTSFNQDIGSMTSPDPIEVLGNATISFAATQNLVGLLVDTNGVLQLAVGASINLSGGATLNGNLDLESVGGVTPGSFALGDSFTLIDAAGGLTGQFQSISGLPTLGTGLTWMVQYTADDVTLTVVSQDAALSSNEPSVTLTRNVVTGDTLQITDDLTTTLLPISGLDSLVLSTASANQTVVIDSSISGTALPSGISLDRTAAGTTTISGGSPTATVDLSGLTLLDGTYQITGTGTVTASLTLSNATLNVASGATLNWTAGDVTGTGTSTLNNSGTSNFTSSGTFTDAGGSFVNNGTVTISNGTVSFDSIVNNGTINQTAGDVTANSYTSTNGSSYNLSGGNASLGAIDDAGALSISAGNLTDSGAGTILETTGTLSESGGAVDVNNIDTYGNITLSSSANFRDAGGFSILEAGSVLNDSAFATYFNGVSIYGTVNITGGTFTTWSIDLDDTGAVNQSGGSASAVTFNMAGSSSLMPAFSLSNGSFETNTTGITWGNFTQTGGTDQVLTSISLTTANYTLSGGLLEAPRMTLSTSQFTQNSGNATLGNVTSSGIMTINGGAFSANRVSMSGFGGMSQYGGSFTSNITILSQSGTPYELYAGTASLGAVTGNGTVTVANGASATINTISTTNSLTVNGGVTFTITTATRQTSAVAIDPANLSIGATGLLNLNNRDLIIHNSSGLTLSNIQSMVNSGYNSGAWNGSTGITSSDIGANEALGYASAAELSISTFDGLAVSSSDLIVKFTYLGDANLDGKVDSTDQNLVNTNFGSGTDWAHGYFEYATGATSLTDLSIVLNNLGLGSGSPL